MAFLLTRSIGSRHTAQKVRCSPSELPFSNIDGNETHYFSVPHRATAPFGPGPPHYQDFTITIKHTTLSKNPLVEG